MPAERPSFFDGLPAHEVEALLGGLERRRFPAGSVVIAEGDQRHELYIAQSGHADVFVADRNGVEHRVGRISPGATVGEMSLFTGQPAAGTVRAAEELDVLVLPAFDFEQLGRDHPTIYRNVGAILSERLALTNRVAARQQPGKVGMLRDWGAPPELGWALACSVAWHARARTLLLYVGGAPPEPAAHLVGAAPDASSTPRADVQVIGSVEELRRYSLAGRIEQLFARYEHILVQAPGDSAQGLLAARLFDLAASPEALPSEFATRFGVVGWTPVRPRGRPEVERIVRVPALTRADQEALRTGLLPSTTGAGRALGWLARDFAGLKVGVALGAGSLRGYAHFGVLAALERLDIEVDYIAGTSVGAAVAGLHALGYAPAKAAEVLDRCGETLFRPTIPVSGLLSSRGLRKFLQGVAGDQLIEDTPIPLAVVAADIETQQEIVFRHGLLWLATLASICIPGIYPPVRIGGRFVVDGGVLNPVPTSAVAEMGANTIIAVRLASGGAPPDYDARARESSAARKPSAVAMMLRAVEVMQSRIASNATEATTITIAPDVTDLPSAKLRNFAVGRRFIASGEAAVEEALPRILAALPWLRPKY